MKFNLFSFGILSKMERLSQFFCFSSSKCLHRTGILSVLCISILPILLLAGCRDRKSFSIDNMINSKIKFDVSQLDKDGLAGSEDGKYSITYEFCIPDTRLYRDKVKKIDSTIVFTKSPGRSMCDKNQILCLGNTHQPHAVKVLNKLAGLSFVEKISETYFE
ncbi:MAG: hypothetical protein IT216_01705 [Saprospiraceae bacterium]|nr:MAG: hypothetical protein UZ08_BCD001002541 [Candidatus Parvibacillus calidus]MCC7147913.1 hypothetical protein [Saprospiraceae bacterium]WKZ62906.1 MAG: hypothetical protein QY315_14210 [Saprospiraceae bacterium]